MQAAESETSQDPNPTQASLRDAQRCLRDADVWIGTRIYGFAGEETNQVAVALDAVLAAQESKDVLLDLLHTARPAGKLYALCGLYHVDLSTFRKTVEGFRGDTNMVETIVADTTGQERVCDIVFSPYGDREGETNIVLRPGQTVAEWLTEHGTDVRPFMDINGGAIPMMLRYGLGD